MKANLLILSTNRADFSHLKLIISELKNSSKINCVFAAAGQHFDKKRGYSISEILDSGLKPDFCIKKRFSFSSESKFLDTVISFEKRLRTIIKMSKADYILVLGDRLELLSVINLALVMNKRIIHISGGEFTQGALDDKIRWMLTQLAYTSFTSGELFSSNILKRYPDKLHVYNAGDPSLESIEKTTEEPLDDINKELGLNLKKKDFILFTFHPETDTGIEINKQFKGISLYLQSTKIPVVCTAPNIDKGGDYILTQLKHIQRNNSNLHITENLGGKRYISLLKNASMAMGNSSSLLIEAPYLKIPSILVGGRQQGRPVSASVIQSGYTQKDIENAVETGLSDNFKKSIERQKLCYEKKDTSSIIRSKLEEIIG